MPKFMCDSNDKVLSENGVEVVHYSIGLDLNHKLKIMMDGFIL